VSDQLDPQGRDHGSHAAVVRSTSGDGFDPRDSRNARGTVGTGVMIITARSASGESAG
jgi:flavin reductase (DIM6/NTAB) family NADH-FMN oxidoreductase RutF